MSEQGTGGGDAAATTTGGEGQGDAAAIAAAAAAAGQGDGGGDGAGDGQPQFTVPEAYKDKPWVKEFKSIDDLFKSHDNALAQLGKPKYGVPSDTATPEEKSAFYKALGVPDDAKGYEFKRPDSVPEEMWDTKHEEKWAGLMREHNVPKGVANALRDEMLKETLEAHTGTTTALNEQLDKAFGDKKLEVAKQTTDLITKAIPDVALRKQIEAGIGNKNTPAFALALGHVLKYTQKTYGLSDTNTDDGGNDSGGKTVAEMRAEGAKLMASEAYTNTMHKDHSATRKQVDGIYNDIGRLTDEARKAK